MKKVVLCIIPLVMVLMGCASGGTAVAETGGSSPGMDLDAAIREAAARMEEKIPSKTMVALVSVASPSTAFSTQVLTRLESAIVSGGKLVVVDRANLDKVREEQGFQLSGEVDDESAKSIGRLLGAGAIVTGSLADLGDVYSLTLKAINIETATVAVSYLADLTKSARVETLLASGGGVAGTQTVQRGNSSGSTTVSAVQAPATSTAQPAPARAQPVAQESVTPPASAYKIGDTGPAGGIVFYDKGNNSGGWRYLEAAPASVEFTATWDPPGRRFDRRGSDDVALGKGLDNTKAIVAFFSQNGGGFGSAAWDCNDLVVNGFDDWFLPSLTELSYIYGNLHRKGLGDFSGNRYWSSTRHESDDDYAYYINFQDASQGGNYRSEKYRVRACRQF